MGRDVFFSCHRKMMMKPYGGWWLRGFAGREIGRWGGVGEEQAGELHGSVNDFLAVQRDVKDRLT